MPSTRSSTRLTTPPPSNSSTQTSSSSKTQLTPGQLQRIETNRLKAKAIREALSRGEPAPPAPKLTNASSTTSPSSSSSSKPAPLAGQKRPAPPANTIEKNSRVGGSGPPPRPAPKFAKYVDYDLSSMTDTHAGFLSLDDDPHSLLTASDLSSKPPGMSLADWSRYQDRQKIKEAQKWDVPISVNDEEEEEEVETMEEGKEKWRRSRRRCWECGSREVDEKWRVGLRCRVCEKCKREKAEKYSLLTKTECREDYLLTDPELKDEELLPHLEQPNPHKSTWSNMMLYVRYQVEEVAIRKWGSLERLDEEFEKRIKEAKRRKEQKFANKLADLKKRTMVDAWKRERNREVEKGRHEHRWGVGVTKKTGEVVRTCEECGFEVEELEF